MAALAGASSAADIQADRLAFIGKMINAGVFAKLEKPARLCRLWTGPRFDGLSFDHKSDFVNVVYAYCVTQDKSANIVVIKDGRTGKEIGDYSASSGGLKLK